MFISRLGGDGASSLYNSVVDVSAESLHALHFLPTVSVGSLGKMKTQGRAILKTFQGGCQRCAEAKYRFGELQVRGDLNELVNLLGTLDDDNAMDELLSTDEMLISSDEEEMEPGSDDGDGRMDTEKTESNLSDAETVILSSTSSSSLLPS